MSGHSDVYAGVGMLMYAVGTTAAGQTSEADGADRVGRTPGDEHADVYGCVAWSVHSGDAAGTRAHCRPAVLPAGRATFRRRGKNECTLM